MSKMEAVNIVMRLFKAMDEAEKKEVVLRIGNELDGSGLADKWEAKTSAPKKKRRGSFKPYWIKRVDSVNPSAKGMDKLAGGWADEKEIVEYQYYLIGVRSDPKKYYIAVGRKGMVASVKMPDGTYKQFSDLTVKHAQEEFSAIVDKFDELM
jgi:hypothetical protein